MNGICYVAFGEQYEYQCTHAVALVREYSDIPIRVLVNSPTRLGKWQGLENVTFDVIEADQYRNRYYKVRLDLFSPFDVTMFMDTDTAVQSAEFLKGFDMALEYDVMFSLFDRIERWDQLPELQLYHRVLKEDELPQNIYKDGVFFFQKTKSTHRLFSEWEQYWLGLGMGRDMPALFPAVARSDKDLRLGVLPPGWDDGEGDVIIHAFASFTASGLPQIEKFKPFDKGRGMKCQVSTMKTL